MQKRQGKPSASQSDYFFGFLGFWTNVSATAALVHEVVAVALYLPSVIAPISCTSAPYNFVFYTESGKTLLKIGLSMLF